MTKEKAKSGTDEKKAVVSEMKSRPAVLLLGFNRPRHMAALIEKLHSAEIRKLFVWMDGPREDNDNDQDSCAAAREEISKADFPFPVELIFNETNLGCKNSVTSGISWFFHHEEEGVILEDDCLPDAGFFMYAQELLDKYRSNQRVLTIAGSMMLPEFQTLPYSYHFSKYPHIWGWATWKSRWEHYDPEIREWGVLRTTPWLRKDVGLSPDSARLWHHKFDQVWRNEIDTWDYQLTFQSFLQESLNIVPHSNLIVNTGFSLDATHTSGQPPEWLIKTTEGLGQVEHPGGLSINQKADRRVELVAYRTRRGPLELLRILLTRVYRLVSGWRFRAVSE